MISVKEINYGRYGRCVELSNGTIDLVATLDIGPRIIRFGFTGGENEFFEDTNDLVTNNKEVFDIFGNKGYWHIYGGHRLWTSPEIEPRTYYPDNESVDYEEIQSGIRLVPKKQIWTQLQYVIEITMSDTDNTVNVIHKITNKSPWAVEFAPWVLSVLAPNGLEIVPQPKKDTGFLGNRVLALWPYTKMNDSRVYWGNNYITLKQDTDADCPFKFGINSEHGWGAYLNHDNMLIKYFPVNDEGNYPDGGMSFETYTNDKFIEMESLGELKLTQPEETVTHTEKWQLFKDVERPYYNNEEEIEKIISKYIQK